jgi:hypothetical protein
MDLLKQPLTPSSRFACLALFFLLIGQFALPHSWSDVSVALAMALLMRAIMLLFPGQADQAGENSSPGR